MSSLGKIDKSKKVDINRVKQRAEQYYKDGDFYCSEAIVKTLKDEFRPDLGDEVVALASGFPVGMGHAGCTCGAVVGGQMTLGLIFGREKAKGKEVEKTMELSKELHDIFQKKNKTLCCRILTKGMKLGSKEHMTQCIRFTGEITEATTKIIVRELELETEEGKIELPEKKGLLRRLLKK